MTAIPRIARPRRRQGAGGGFTIVDPGGNWLRVTSGSVDGDVDAAGGELQRVLENAARQGDARGDESRAIAVLDAGLARHPDAPFADRLPVLLYLAELLGRTGDVTRASTVIADLRERDLDDASRAMLAEIEEIPGVGPDRPGG